MTRPRILALTLISVALLMLGYLAAFLSVAWLLWVALS